MCDHNHDAPQRGKRLEDGHAHQEDHEQWSRRRFLSTVGLAGATGTMFMGGLPAQAFGHTPMLASLANLDSERSLVLIQLEGGNDGLNTIIPVNNDIYRRSRPTLAIPKSQALPLGPDVGMHPGLATWQDLYGRGHMAVVQGVGYDNPDLSHFRSTDIWVSATDSNSYRSSGWAGRYLEEANPGFGMDSPDKPIAVQLGGANMLLRGEGFNMGMSFESPEVFEELAAGGTLYDPAAAPATLYGKEMAYARQVANNSFRYAEALQAASGAGRNQVTYPDAELGASLSIVARLIKGNLGSRIYVVSLAGFDTHSDQEYMHQALLTELAESVRAFIADLEADNRQDDVLVMTFSEFGRTLRENGSAGTDHATAAPLFLFGSALEGGLFGDMPDLVNVNADGDLIHTVDFRSVYATVLAGWFGLGQAEVDAVLGRRFDSLGFLSPATGTGTRTRTSDPTLPGTATLAAGYPNPFSTSTRLTFTVPQIGPVRVQVFNTSGRIVASLVEGTRQAGRHEVTFAPQGLPSGTYFCRLEVGGAVVTRPVVFVR